MGTESELNTQIYKHTNICVDFTSEVFFFLIHYNLCTNINNVNCDSFPVPPSLAKSLGVGGGEVSWISLKALF